jgi:putative ABC transport system permease protein
MINTINIATKAILLNKSRSFLTTLGVIIGVFAVVMLTAIGSGLQAYIADQFDQLGANTIIVFPGTIFTEDGNLSPESQFTASINSKLEIRDARNLQRLREFVEVAVPLAIQSDNISFQSERKKISIVGSTENLSQAQAGLKIEKGRFFTRSENINRSKVMILGHEVANEIFGKIDPIGKRVRLGSQTYTVIGVYEKTGGFGGDTFDTFAFIPIETLFRHYNTRSIMRIIVKTHNTQMIPQAMIAIENLLLQTYDEDDFSVVDQSEILDAINEILAIMTLGLGGIAGISLLVGGIGIMNIMLVSVTERTREIGLRKALGATPNQILFQFLVEASMLSVLGGIIGLILAFLGTLVLQNFFPAVVTPDAVALALGVSIGVGIIFGSAPARKASRLQPIEALRYE